MSEMTTIDRGRGTPLAPATSAQTQPALPSEIFKPLLDKFFRAKVRLIDQEELERKMIVLDGRWQFRQKGTPEQKQTAQKSVPPLDKYRILARQLEAALSRRCTRRDVFVICGALVGCFPNAGSTTDSYMDGLAEALRERAAELAAGPEILAAAAWRLTRRQKFLPTISEALAELDEVHNEFVRAARMADDLAEELLRIEWELEDLGMIEAEGEHAF